MGYVGLLYQELYFCLCGSGYRPERWPRDHNQDPDAPSSGGLMAANNSGSAIGAPKVRKIMA